jgi:SAM-dependent methyltransferase
MGSIKDNRGYNQGFKPSTAMKIRMKRRCDYMIDQIDSDTDTIKILEIGSGTGEISYLLSQKLNAKILGTDICLSFIERSREKYFSLNLKYEVLDFNDTESINKIIGNEKFDYIVGNGILHHLFYKLDESLSNINYLLNANGKLIFLEPNILNPYCFLIFKFPFFRKFANLEPGEMAFTKKYIKKKLEDAKFTDIKVEYRDFLLPNTPSPLIWPVIWLGNIFEKTPILKKLSQSIYVSAKKK